MTVPFVLGKLVSQRQRADCGQGGHDDSFTFQQGIQTGIGSDHDQIDLLAGLDGVLAAHGTHGFNQVNLVIDGLDNVDDGNQLQISVIDVTSPVATVIKQRDRNKGSGSYKDTIRTLQNDDNGNTQQIKIRITDELGQSVETGIFAIELTQIPNEIAFHGNSATSVQNVARSGNT